MRILFVTHTRIGDAVLSTGVLGHLLDANPGAEATVVAGPLAAPLFRPVARVVPLPKRPAKLHWFDLWAAAIGTRWDLAIDLRHSFVTRLVLAGRRLEPPRARPGEHRVVHLARMLGLEARPPAPRLWTTPREEEAAARLVPPGAPVLAIGPAAASRLKTWRAERFAALIERLTGAGGILAGARVAVLGAAGEREQARPVLAAVPAARRIDLVGTVDLVTAYACLKRASFFVGNDSGLMHMAAAAGVPTLGLFGPTPAWRYAPWGERAAYVASAPPVEAPVAAPDADAAGRRTQMDGLAVEAVAEAAALLWRRAQGRAA